MVVPHEKSFFVYNGPVCKTIEDLVDAISHMDDHTFYHHVHEDNNDFANWLRDVHGQRILAKKMSMTTDRKTITKMLFQSMYL